MGALPARALARALEGTLWKLTAKLPQSSSSWACYLVFKDRAACSASRLVLPSSAFADSLVFRGALLLFEPAELVNCLLRCFVPAASLGEGRGFYFFSASRVNRFRLIYSTENRPAFFRARGAACTTTAFVVNTLFPGPHSSPWKAAKNPAYPPNSRPRQVPSRASGAISGLPRRARASPASASRGLPSPAESARRRPPSAGPGRRARSRR